MPSPQWEQDCFAIDIDSDDIDVLSASTTDNKMLGMRIMDLKASLLTQSRPAQIKLILFGSMLIKMEIRRSLSLI